MCALSTGILMCGTVGLTCLVALVFNPQGMRERVDGVGYRDRRRLLHCGKLVISCTCHVKYIISAGHSTEMPSTRMSD